MLLTGKAAAHMQVLPGARGRLAGARADAWTAWCLRSAESVGERARAEGRPRIESRQLFVGDDFGDDVAVGLGAVVVDRKAWNNDWRPDHWPDAGYALHA